jgi:hypothetical protein
MSEAPKPGINPSIIAALIGLAGTIAATLITVLATRPVSPQATSAVMEAVSPEAQVTAAPAVMVAASPEAQVTEAPASLSSGTLPTVRYPDGKPFELFYDENSFYFLNRSDAAIPINRVAFERLSNDSVPLNRFTGTRWAEFYSSSTPGKCVALEILGSPPYLNPPECGQDVFLSLRTPTRDDPTIFWTVQEGSHEFRVLWREGGQDEEIARCEIGAGICEVFLP